MFHMQISELHNLKCFISLETQGRFLSESRYGKAGYPTQHTGHKPLFNIHIFLILLN